MRRSAMAAWAARGVLPGEHVEPGDPRLRYGIRYDHGLFRQLIKGGYQLEFPEDWLELGNPWQFERAEISYDIGFGGSVEAVSQLDSQVQHVWHPAERVSAVAYDIPIVGWRGRHVNTLRLWSARAVDPIRLDAFNLGDHVGAISERARVEAISRVLYPSDETPAGQELRLRQEYFFAAASFAGPHPAASANLRTIRTLPDKAAIQLNDTHPSIAIVELMRILIDVHHIDWTKPGALCSASSAIRTHFAAEALESWPVSLMERLLPRHMQILYMINVMFLDEVNKAHPQDDRLLSTLSLVDEQHGRRVRMGHLSFLGSHKINGVSALHDRSVCDKPYSAISMPCFRTGSTTRPTASPSAAGFTRPTLGSPHCCARRSAMAFSMMKAPSSS